ncbi:hypothetical protein F5Y19DRAFT_327611 [Xylariaceae sp. FL1651]|nr:hypothetical protein F5Y19DRAFT_327611 [Xylariaceae sp. FL1651]
MCQIHNPCGCISLCSITDITVASHSSFEIPCSMSIQINLSLKNAEKYRIHADELDFDIEMDLDMGQFTEATQRCIAELSSVKDKIPSLRAETRDVLVRLDSKSADALKQNENLCAGIYSAFGWRLADFEELRTCRIHQAVSLGEQMSEDVAK